MSSPSKKTRNMFERFTPVVLVIKNLLMQLRDRQVRYSISKALDKAVVKCDQKAVIQLLEMVNKHLDGDVVQKKLPVYTDPPSRIQAALDFIIHKCGDLAQFPDLNDYFALAERHDFLPGRTNKTGKTGKTGDYSDRMGKGLGNHVDTIVKKGMVMASADTQSGKSLFMLCYAIKSMICGFTPIIVLRNITGDSEQLQSRQVSLVSSMNEYIARSCTDKTPFTFPIISGDKLVCKKGIVVLGGGRPGLIMCLGNETQLGRVMKAIKQNGSTGKYDLLIDEIDYVDYGLKKNGESTGTAALLIPLKKGAHQVVGVTATPLDAIFSEKDLKAANQMRLTIPSDYRGFMDISVKKLGTKDIYALNKKADYKAQLKHDPSLHGFLTGFSKSTPCYSWKDRQNIPNICIIKNTRFVYNMEELVKGIKQDFGDKVDVVSYNGGSGEGISETLQDFKRDGGCKKHPRIIIVAGDLAGRSISFVSKDYTWHTTDMYYIPAKTTPVPDMIQSAGRLCGRNKGGAPLVLHTHEKVANAIWDGFYFTDEVITKALAEPLLQGEEARDFGDLIKGVRMNKMKFPTGRRITNKVKMGKGEFNLVNGNDGGKSLYKYKYEEVIDDEKDETNMKKVKVEVKAINEVKRLRGMFAKWSNNPTTNISKFMKNLNPTKIYTEKEIRLLSKTHKCELAALLKRTFQKSNGYGEIIKKNGLTYRLDKRLVKEYKRYW
jgi:hypothetical protein